MSIGPTTTTRLEGPGNIDGSFPSVNTCVHYVKVPEYSCKEVLKKQLLVVSLPLAGASAIACGFTRFYATILWLSHQLTCSVFLLFFNT